MQRDGSVVGTKDLGRQPGAEAAQVLVEDGRVEAIEEVVALLLVVHEEAQVLEDPLLHLNEVVVTDRVLAEEVKLDNELFV